MRQKPKFEAQTSMSKPRMEDYFQQSSECLETVKFVHKGSNILHSDNKMRRQTMTPDLTHKNDMISHNEYGNIDEDDEGRKSLFTTNKGGFKRDSSGYFNSDQLDDSIVMA